MIIIIIIILIILLLILLVYKFVCLDFFDSTAKRGL
jgi:flagellar biogenesis protein FliO